ncbi:hypothetical protein NC661_05830 [Aquibacillus koreensis]|uniref:HPr domain-containing protein n=1 Tax=Aquibacillus koreensis TaxID=279446 RepID=A0A9X3WKC5_9BACI|nr:hypothetical protein [Aquibacillus koreensis]MCT2537131.1 hypothetical protein [Aquibacillus koreensis]MDC3419886.1 hypothetical protein [Aquibacillus koreensis]
MRKVISSQLLLEKSLRVNTIINIHAYAKEYSGTIYFIKNNRIIDTSNFSKLLSFLLLIKKGEQFKVMIDGIDVVKAMNDITAICSQKLSSNHLSSSFRILPQDSKVKL